MTSNHSAAPRRYIVDIIGGCGSADLPGTAAMLRGFLPLSTMLLSGATAFAMRPSLGEIPGGPVTIKMPDDGSGNTIQATRQEFPLVVARESVGYGWQPLPDSVPLFIGDSRVLDMPRA
ncbi:MAG: hypothetical protein K2W82_16855 [Candidatus Obscuribacterales bacterium]|nr:hypothetical protein [Candidatus Obscuribacterales bacterium]